MVEEVQSCVRSFWLLTDNVLRFIEASCTSARVAEALRYA